MKKIKYSIVFALISAIFLIIPGARSTLQPYYSGEAIVFNNRLYAATVNNQSLELFSFDNGLKRLAVLAPDEKDHKRFFDLLFNIEDSRLCLYLVNGRYLYKYRIGGNGGLTLVKKAKDNSGDYFHGLEKSGSRILTIGTKGVKLWNYELVNITSYNVHSTFAENISISRDENFIVKVLKGQFRIIDTKYRVLAREIGLNTKEDHARHVYFDNLSGASYIADDQYLKKIYLDGRVEQFKHISRLGYDADGIDGSPYVYFSDGIGAVKIRKDDMQAVDWRFTTEDGPGNGWAMGLRQAGGYLVLFNGSAICVYDLDFNLLGHYDAGAGVLPDFQPAIINLDRYNGFTGDLLYVYGRHFGLNETVQIEMLDEIWQVEANNDGLFSTRIRIPGTAYPDRRYDVKATGLKSGKTYSVSFEVLDSGMNVQ